MRKGRKEAFKKVHEDIEKDLEKTKEFESSNLPFLPAFDNKEERLLRILPRKEYLEWLGKAKDGEVFDDFAFPFVEVWKHFNVGKSEAALPCSAKYGQGRCPICEEVDALFATKDEDDIKTAKAMRAKKQFVFPVLWKDVPDGAMGPYLWTLSPTWAELVTALLANPDYNDLDDPEEGHDLTVTRSGMGLNTKYTIHPKPKPSMALEDREGELDWDKVDEWVEVLPSFETYGHPFLTQEEVLAVLHGATVGDCLKARETGDDPEAVSAEKEEPRRGRRRRR